MSPLVSFISIIHIILCVLIVLAVLVQSGKGAEISASFGGSSQTVFGSSGGANFFTTFTGVCAACFMITSVILATQGGSRANKSVMEGAVPATAPVTAPAVPPVSTTTSGEKAMAPTSQAEKDVVPAHPQSGAQIPDKATQNAIEPGAAIHTTPAAKAPTPKPIPMH